MITQKFNLIKNSKNYMPVETETSFFISHNTIIKKIKQLFQYLISNLFFGGAIKFKSYKGLCTMNTKRKYDKR